MRLPTLVALSVLFTGAMLAAEPAAQPDYKQLTANLSRTPREHPYLIFTAKEKPALLQQLRSDPKSAELLERILQESRRLAFTAVPTEVPPRETHTRYVGKDTHTQFINQLLTNALNLAFTYQVTGDEMYAAKAWEYANIICAEDSWMQNAHYFEIIYPRVWPYGAKDDQVAFTYDITASAVSQKMAYIYDWLYTGLPKAKRDRIRSGLLEKAIMRVRGNYEYLWWATAYKCNWSGICHTGLGMAALALLNEDPQLVDVVARSCEGVNSMLDHIGEDGGWQEGRGYWAYGVGESLRFIDAIKRVSDGKINLFKHRGLFPHPSDFALFGLTGGFGDGSGAPVGESHVMNKLAQESGDPRAAWYAKNYVRPGSTVYDLLWPATTVKPEKPTEASKFFPSIDWAVMRKDFDPGSLTIATKAGPNDDPHHGHLDCGTFNLTWHNLNYVGEVARMPYDEKYFGELRWTYLEARTTGHNVVMVNGEEQICAKLKDQPWKTDVGGKITGYGSEADWGFTVLDPTKAYPGKELKKWNRWIALDKAQNIAIVVDKVACAVGSTIEVKFHPGVESEVGTDHVTLTGESLAAEPGRRPAASPAAINAERNPAREGGAGRGAARRSTTGAAMEMSVLTEAAYTLVQGRQPDMPVTAEPNLAWVPYFSTVVKAPATENVIVSVFYPAELKSKDGALPFKLTKEGGQPAVVCTVNGKTQTYVFATDKVERK